MKNQLIYRYIYSKGVAECGKETTTRNFFFCGSVDLLPPLPTKYSMFSKFQCFFKMFFVIWVHFFLIHVSILFFYLEKNLQDLHHAQKCSVYESLLGDNSMVEHGK